MTEVEELEQLIGFFKQLGAEPESAAVMARQLAKRASQIAEKEGIARVEAMARLLDMVRKGRSGEGYEGP